MGRNLRVGLLTMVHHFSIRSILEARGYSTPRLFLYELTDISRQSCETGCRHWLFPRPRHMVGRNCAGRIDTNKVSCREPLVIICRVGICTRRMLVGNVCNMEQIGWARNSGDDGWEFYFSTPLLILSSIQNHKFGRRHSLVKPALAQN